MTDILLIIISLVLAVAVGFLIPVLVEMKATAKELIKLFKTNEETLNQTLDELRETLKSVRGVADDINGITSDARTFSRSIADIGHHVEEIGKSLDVLTSKASARVSGLKVGALTALDVLIHNLAKRGDGK